MKSYLKEAGNIHLSYYIKAAKELDVDYEMIVHGLIAKFSWQRKHWYILNTVTPLINSPGKTIASRKNLTNLVLNKAGLSVPIQETLKDEQQALAFFEKHKDIVLKPKQNLGGKGVSIKPSKVKDVQTGFWNAYNTDLSKTKYKVLGEKYTSGENYRLLTLDKKVIGVIKRNKPQVVGNGLNTITELIEIANRERKQNSKIPIDKETEQVLKAQDLDLNHIPPKKQIVYVRYNTNLTQGGTTEEYSKHMHPYYEDIAVKVLGELDIKLGGIDLIVEDITRPSNYIINEVNYNPGLRIHYQVDKGEKIEVAKPIIKYIRDHY